MRIEAWTATRVALVVATLLGAAPASSEDLVRPLDLDARLDVAGIDPNPVVIEQPAVLLGTGFGERGSVEILLTGGETPSRRTMITDAQVRSWSPTRIELQLPIEMEGSYGLHVRRRTTMDSPESLANRDGISFEARLPRPMIGRYDPPHPCPGQRMTIHGRGFTSRLGAFTMLWEKISPERTASITLRPEHVSRWTDTEIRLRLPSDLPAYVSPGVGFRVSLGVRRDGGLGIRTTGPSSRLAEPCRGSAGPTRLETLTPKQRSGLQPKAAPGRGAPPQPVPLAGGPMTLRFQLAPMASGQVGVGSAIVYGGTFNAGPDLARVLRSNAVQIEWSILRGTGIVRSGLLDVRSARTPWLERVTADRPGTYRLSMRLSSGGPPGVSFGADLSGSRVVVPDLSQVRDPHAGQQQKAPRGGLPAPEGLEPRRP